jgi:hypothetical protein
LTELHGGKTAGHLGEHKTLAKVRMRFFWHGQKHDIIDFCKKCNLCAQKKPPHIKNKAQLQQYVVGAPLERVSLDIVGPLPRSDSGNKYVLVVGDHFTKWMEAYPLPNIEAKTIAEKFTYEFISRYGVPLEIHTDQGSQFQSHFFRELYSILGAHQTRTTAFRPQSDGLVERFNRTLENMLSLYVDVEQTDWDKFVAPMTMAYRATPQESSQVTPNTMVLGRDINLPIDLMVGCPQKDPPQDQCEYVEILRERFELCFEYARDKLGKSSVRQKKYYDIKFAGKPWPVCLA